MFVFVQQMLMLMYVLHVLAEFCLLLDVNSWNGQSLWTMQRKMKDGFQPSPEITSMGYR